MTLRDNILYGKPFRERKYKKILEACALKPDLEILSAGDMTEIGMRVSFNKNLKYHNYVNIISFHFLTLISNG